MATYRDRVRIEQRTEAAGDPSPTWGTVTGATSCPCTIEAVSGGESMRGRQVESHIKAVVIMPYRSGITSEMRLICLSGPNNGKTLQIDSVLPIDRRHQGAPPELEMHCIL